MVERTVASLCQFTVQFSIVFVALALTEYGEVFMYDVTVRIVTKT